MKLIAKAHENRGLFQKETNIPTIHFQMQAVGFREGNTSLPCRHLCLDGICYFTEIGPTCFAGKKKKFHQFLRAFLVELCHFKPTF